MLKWCRTYKVAPQHEQKFAQHPIVVEWLLAGGVLRPNNILGCPVQSGSPSISVHAEQMASSAATSHKARQGEPAAWQLSSSNYCPPRMRSGGQAAISLPGNTSQQLKWQKEKKKEKERKKEV